MIATWMLYTLLVGTLVVAAARCAESLLRLMSRPARWVWVVALAAAIAVPMVTALAPTQAVELSEASVAPAAAPAETRGSIAVTLATLPATRSLDRPLLLAWAGLTLALLAVLLHGIGVLHGRRREWVRREVDGRPLLVASDTGPAVIGWRHMQIVVPTWVLGLDDDARAMILAHEEEHIHARDPQLMLAGLLAAMLIPWHLPLWYAWRRLRMAIELDCDARVLAGGVNRRSYGEILLEAGSRSTRTGLPALATFAERAEQLEERLSALAPTPVRQRGARMAGAGVLAGALLSVACTVDNPLGIDLSDRELVSKVRLSQELPAVDNPEVVGRIVRSLVAARFPDAPRTGSVPDGVTAVLVLDPQRRILRAGTRGGPGVGDLEITLEDLAGEGIESIEVIRGRAIGVENLEGVILVQLREPGQEGQGQRALRTSVEAASDAETLLTPKVVLRQQDR